MTENDSRFSIDRTRPDSWSFINDKNQTGSNIYFYSNTTTSPLGTQDFNILHEDISTLYSVVGINKTSTADNLPLMALFSPSSTSFYQSRWIYTIDPAEYLLQGEKVLLYWNNDPVNIYPNLRHIELLFNAGASTGTLGSGETIFLMSLNTQSTRPASSIFYNAYNCGFVLNNGIHNDYQFNSGIKSKADLALSKLTVDNNLLSVNVGNVVGVLNTNLDTMSFSTIDTSNTSGLNVVIRPPLNPVNFTFTISDIDSITNTTPSIDIRPFSKIAVFGKSTHTGGGSHNIIIQYSSDDSTFYDTNNLIATTNNIFSYDNQSFCVSYIRFKFQVSLNTLTFNISLK